MADRDTSLPAGLDGLANDLADVQMLRLVTEIDVKIYVHPKLGGEREDDRDVPARVGVVVRAAADELGAHAERPPQQRLGSRRLQDSLLSEGAELQIDGRGVLTLEREHRLHAHE